MAHLWIWHEPQDNNPNWALVPLKEGIDSFVLTDEREAPVRSWTEPRIISREVLIVRVNQQAGESWVLLSPKKKMIRINGFPALAGIYVLQDQDEILVDGSRFFFSTERLARVEKFPEEDRKQAVMCPRCKMEITSDHYAVQCPNPHCRLWYHQDDELNCWTYSESCSMCGQPTSMKGFYRWTPHAL